MSATQPARKPYPPFLSIPGGEPKALEALDDAEGTTDGPPHHEWG